MYESKRQDTHNKVRTATPGRKDAYAAITDRIVRAIEAGAADFEMPWHKSDMAGGRPRNALTGKAYSGVNVVSLWVSALTNGYGSQIWATYKQWNELGAQVRRREKGTPSVFYKTIDKEVEDRETGELRPERSYFARTSWVFNADQVDGYSAPGETRKSLVEIVEDADRLVAATGADIRHGGERAFYRPSSDHIQMPDQDRFKGTLTSSATESYYAVLFHELTHWTGHERRLDRNLSGRFGDKAYALEELVAELGGAFLCADHKVSNSPRPDHAAYVASWLQVLKRDSRAVFTAASKASEAAAYLAELHSK